MRILTRLFILFLLILLLTGCQDQPVVPTAPQPEAYDLILRDGIYYLRWKPGYGPDTLPTYDPDLGIRAQMVPYLYFASLDEMRSDFLTGNFTEDELRSLARFPADEDGLVKLCNFDDLYQPVYHNSLIGYSVNFSTWPRENGAPLPYSFDIQYSDRIDFHFTTVSEEYFQKCVSSFKDRHTEITAQSGNENITLSLPDHTDQQRHQRATIYTYTNAKIKGSSFKEYLSSLETAHGIFYIHEKYEVFSDSRKLDFIYIYALVDGQYLQISAYDLPAEPTAEWITSFALTQYSR